jgi:hypothetical protein
LFKNSSGASSKNTEFHSEKVEKVAHVSPEK